MAIGTLAAIGLAASGIGAGVSAISSGNAANKAADTSAQVAAQNNALARDVYGQNKQALSPFINRGNQAGDTLNAMLGLGGPQQQTQPNALAQFAQNPGELFSPNGAPFGAGIADAGYINTDSFFNPQQQQQPQQPQQTSQQAANAAFDTFRNSTNYNWRLDQGFDALNSRFAGAGVLRSGAAAKEALQYGQNFASNELGNYQGLLANQQGVGLSGASALAGVGQNYVNNVSANNNSAGTAQANAYLSKGQNNPFAAVLGTAGGFASSYGK